MLSQRFRRLSLAWLVMISATLSTFPAWANDRITAHVVNPTGFIKPGESDLIFVELRNPVNSGVSVARVNALNASSSTTPASAAQIAQPIRQPISGCPDVICLVDGELPLQPGEVITVVVASLAANEALEDDTRLWLNNLRLGLVTTDMATPAYDVYLDYNVLRIVSQNGSGDPAIFEDETVQQALVGTLQADVNITLRMPETILAGEHFSLIAEITNTGDIPLIWNTGLLNPSVAGEHRHSFVRQSCVIRLCVLAGEQLLAPGQSVLVRPMNYFYDHAQLFPGELILYNMVWRLSDQNGRNYVQYMDTPISIEVFTHENETTENLEKTIPDSQPLQITDLWDSDDQLLVHDPNTGADWLRLGSTTGQSLQDVQALISNGGDLQGFELADSSDIEQLLLNHLHASGIAAQRHNLRMVSSSSALYTAINSFLDKIQANDIAWGTSSAPVARGRIRDLAPLKLNTTAPHNEAMFLHITGTAPSSEIFSFAVTPLQREPAHELISPDRVGTWLIRRGQPLPERPGTETSFLLDELEIPVVQVNGEYFKVTLRLADTINNLLQLTGLTHVAPVSGAPVFTDESGQVVLPRAHLMSMDTTVATEHFRLVLEYLPDSNPPLLHVRELTHVP